MVKELIDKPEFKVFAVPEQVSIADEINNEMTELNWITGVIEQIDFLNKHTRSFMLELRIIRRRSN